MFKKTVALFMTIAIFAHHLGCAAGFPPKLTPPEVRSRLKVIKLRGFPQASPHMTTRMVSFHDGSRFRLEAIDMTLRKAKFIHALEQFQAADHIVLKGPAEYQVVVSQAYERGGIHGITQGFLFASYIIVFIPLLIPWGDAAEAGIALKVYDQNDRLVASIREYDRIVYGMWIGWLIKHMDDRRAVEIYDALNERAAIRTIEAIQEDMAN